VKGDENTEKIKKKSPKEARLSVGGEKTQKGEDVGPFKRVGETV